jgi:hypothetical protein
MVTSDALFGPIQAGVGRLINDYGQRFPYQPGAALPTLGSIRNG